MHDSLSRLIRTSDPTQPGVPHHRISGEEPPVRIFQKNWQEALTLISFKTFLIFCLIFEIVIFSVTFYYRKSVFSICLYFIIGIPLWLVTEYGMHRFIFHFASDNPHIQRLVYIFHGNHHIQPNHPYRTLMPIIVTLPIGVLLWAISISILGIGLGSALFSGFFSGYVCYDTTHYATHNFKMKFFPFSLLKRHHLLHHYGNEEHNYAISFPYLDNVFKTRLRKNHNKRKR